MQNRSVGQKAGWKDNIRARGEPFFSVLRSARTVSAGGRIFRRRGSPIKRNFIGKGVFFCKAAGKPLQGPEISQKTAVFGKKYPYLCFRDEIKDDIARMYKNYGL